MAEESKNTIAEVAIAGQKIAEPPAQKPPEENPEVLKLKTQLSKANAEAAEYKRKWLDEQDEQKRAESERAEAAKKLQDELAEYRKRERIASYKSKFMEAGVAADMADLMAKSLPEGVSDEYFATTKQYFEKQKQEIRAEALNAQPTLSVGTPPTSQSAAEAENAKYRKWIGL